MHVSCFKLQFSFSQDSKKNERSGEYSDSEGSGTQNADGIDLASSHSSDEDGESSHHA